MMEKMLEDSKTNPRLRRWLADGRCPECGELGSLDVMGGARCSTHGCYQMVMSLPPLPVEASVPVPKTSTQASVSTGVMDSAQQMDAARKDMVSLWAFYLPTNHPCTTGLILTPPYVAPMTAVMLAGAFTEIEKMAANVKALGMNPVTWNYLLRTLPDICDEEQNSTLSTKGCIWGAEVWVSSKVDANVILLATEVRSGWPQYCVRMVAI